MSTHTLEATQSTCPVAVLDSQAVLDWLYFTDPGTASWEAARRAGHWQWAASEALRDELAHVLGRRQLPPPRGLGAEALLATFAERARFLGQPAAVAHGPLRCSDPDDQKFVDFAISHRACWLVSRDRAVLKLRRRAWALHGLRIVTPADWTATLPLPSS